MDSNLLFLSTSHLTLWLICLYCIYGSSVFNEQRFIQRCPLLHRSRTEVSKYFSCTWEVNYCTGTVRAAAGHVGSLWVQESKAWWDRSSTGTAKSQLRPQCSGRASFSCTRRCARRGGYRGIVPFLLDLRLAKGCRCLKRSKKKIMQWAESLLVPFSLTSNKVRELFCGSCDKHHLGWVTCVQWQTWTIQPWENMGPEDVVKGKEQQKQLWQILVKQKVQPLITKHMNNY